MSGTDVARSVFPAGSCDCHVHIYGPYDRFPAHSEGRFSPTQPFPVERLFAVWESVGISRQARPSSCSEAGDGITFSPSPTPNHRPGSGVLKYLFSPAFEIANITLREQ